jgi:hypothetical protein
VLYPQCTCTGKHRSKATQSFQRQPPGYTDDITNPSQVTQDTCDGGGKQVQA